MHVARDVALLMVVAAGVVGGVGVGGGGRGGGCLAQCGPQFMPGDQIPGVSYGAGLPGVASVRAGLEWDFDGAGPQPSKLIVAGTFTDAGGLPAPNLALWDGSLWAPFGAGANGTVSRLIAHNSEVIAAGAFTTIGGVYEPSGLAADDGAAWRELPAPGTGAGGTIKQILSHAGQLYACGSFTFDGVPGNYVASFDGATWSAVGAPFDGPINDVALYNGQLIAGGAFTMSGSSVAFCLAKWDGVNWTTFNGGTTDAVNCIRQFGTTLYVGGVFTGAGSPPVNTGRLARWSGTAWAPVGVTSTFSEVQTIGGTGTTLVAGGIQPQGTRTMKYVTIAGATMPPSDAALNGNYDNDIFWIGGYQGALHMAGTYQATPLQSGEIMHFSISRVIAGRWHALTSGLNGRIKAVAVHDGQVIGVGDFTRWKNTPVSKMVTWNGTDWVQFNTAFPANMQGLPELLKSSNGRLFVYGAASEALRASWNGTSWVAWENNVQGSVHSLTEYRGRVMAGVQQGWRQASHVPPDIYSADFARTVWTTIPFAGGHMAGGEFVAANPAATSVPAARVAFNNGVSWSAMGAGLSGGTVYKLLDVGGVPHAFGAFNASGATALNGAARWDGAAWVPLGTPPVQTPFYDIRDAAAAGEGGRIFVVGNYASGTPTNGLLEFDGVDWLSRGGLNGEGEFAQNGGTSITVVGNEVWITGKFARAGGVPSFQLARYRVSTPAPQINAPPEAVAVHRGEPASFTVEAVGAGTLTYQWRRNGVPLGVPSEPSLQIAAVTDGNRGVYDCVVSDACGVETASASARLTVLTADLGIQGGGPGTDGLWDNNDFIAFIELFFAQDPAADLGQQGGEPGGDGSWDNNDFIVLINLFFEAV